MQSRLIDDVEVDVCPSHGVWLDQQELLTITESHRHTAPSLMARDLIRQPIRPAVDHARVLDCPHCAQAMHVHPHRDVHIDWCREHGVWLDTGELPAFFNNLRLDPLYRQRVALRMYESRF
jgi:Zn-finger nucleic acid-binding protein